MAELKKCPFCGGEAKVAATENISSDYESLVYHDCVYCTKCHAIIERDTREEAIEAWNRRATESEIRAKAIEEFAKWLHELCGVEIGDYQYPDLLHESRIDEIAEKLKGEKE